ncbi:unnamed protein product [Rangifer tarandus platyrhynchus]|uniref:Uncharacterized protein n=1 Tax=Rangifer tarandus platyrhynchus TaxID=3082113 RepID=A0AC59Z0R1_RANTA
MKLWFQARSTAASTPLVCFRLNLTRQPRKKEAVAQEESGQSSASHILSRLLTGLPQSSVGISRPQGTATTGLVSQPAASQNGYEQDFRTWRLTPHLPQPYLENPPAQQACSHSFSH